MRAFNCCLVAGLSSGGQQWCCVTFLHTPACTPRCRIASTGARENQHFQPFRSLVRASTAPTVRTLNLLLLAGPPGG